MRRFCHKLALLLNRTVEELLDSISFDELSDWIEYLNPQPENENTNQVIPVAIDNPQDLDKQFERFREIAVEYNKSLGG